MLVRLLLAARDETLVRRLSSVVESPDVELRVTHGTGDDGDGHEYDLVLISHDDFGEDTRALVTAWSAPRRGAAVIVLSSDAGAARRAALLAVGATAVLDPTISDALLRDALLSIVANRQSLLARHENGRDDADVLSLAGFVTSSPTMRRLIETARKIAPAKNSLLILGETGVGKEHLARAIHNESARREAPFLVVNCGAIPEALWESELFGHEVGAFTGAIRQRRGAFELAHRGTLLLDEIAEMPPHLQVKLLRVLQDKTVQRVGGERSFEVDVRILAATNRDLVAEMKEGRFRQDLYYRLSVVSLTVPPLRERREDIPDLVLRSIGRFEREIGVAVGGIDDSALDALVAYDWPGNVRELLNVIERAALLSSGTIGLVDLPDEIVSAAAPEPTENHAEAIVPAGGSWNLPLAEARRRWLAHHEKIYLERLLGETAGNIGETAARAGIDPRSLYDKMRRHGLRKEQFKG